MEAMCAVHSTKPKLEECAFCGSQVCTYCATSFKNKKGAVMCAKCYQASLDELIEMTDEGIEAVNEMLGSKAYFKAGNEFTNNLIKGAFAMGAGAFSDTLATTKKVEYEIGSHGSMSVADWERKHGRTFKDEHGDAVQDKSLRIEKKRETGNYDGAVGAAAPFLVAATVFSLGKVIMKLANYVSAPVRLPIRAFHRWRFKRKLKKIAETVTAENVSVEKFSEAEPIAAYSPNLRFGKVAAKIIDIRLKAFMKSATTSFTMMSPLKAYKMVRALKKMKKQYKKS